FSGTNSRYLLRHAPEMTLLCSPKVTHRCTEIVQFAGPAKMGGFPLASRPASEGNWFGKNERLTRKETRRGTAFALSLPAGKREQIVFSVWVGLSEQEWVTFGWRRGRPLASGLRGAPQRPPGRSASGLET